MKTELLNKFGPCGLSCEKCFAFHNSQIKIHAEQLKINLGEFDAYANRFVSLLEEPAFTKYPDFKEVLNVFAAGNCLGCRKQVCHLFQECKVRNCYKEKGVDYCYECEEFPCEKTGFDENLIQRWRNINQKIRKIGLENYYLEIMDRPRY